MAMPTSRSRWVAGTDGCKAGWVVVLRERQAGTYIARVVADFRAVLALPETPEVIAVDVPIGLLATARAGGRECEVVARQLLGMRASSVFSAPTRAALAAFRAGSGYQAVSIANRAGVANAPGISWQAFGILPKIDQVDGVLIPAAQNIVREVHPELCFAEANGGTPMSYSKKRPRAGPSERRCSGGSALHRRAYCWVRRCRGARRRTTSSMRASPAGRRSTWLRARPSSLPAHHRSTRAVCGWSFGGDAAAETQAPTHRSAGSADFAIARPLSLPLEDGPPCLSFLKRTTRGW